MPRKTSKLPSRKVETTCPSCKGKGTMPDTKPEFEPNPAWSKGSSAPRYRVKRLINIQRKCIRCGGRGTITFWTDRPVDA